jgi:hypothetical protein
MLTFDYYAAPEDHEALLAWLFAEHSCTVYELSSGFEQELTCFTSAEEILAAAGERWKSVERRATPLSSRPCEFQLRLSATSSDGRFC